MKKATVHSTEIKYITFLVVFVGAWLSEAHKHGKSNCWALASYRS